MLEGGGKTPIFTPIELEELGYKLVAYPLSLIGVSIGAMQVSFCTSYYPFPTEFLLVPAGFIVRRILEVYT